MRGKGMRRLLEFLRRLQQRLRRDAANIEASAAEPIAILDAGDAHAELRRADRGDIPAGTAADDDDVETLTHRRCPCRWSRLHVEEDALRVLDAFLDADEEGHRLAAIDDAMIVA